MVVERLPCAGKYLNSVVLMKPAIKLGPILVIDNDREDYDLVFMALKELNVPNEIRWLHGGEEALDFLRTTPEQPFLILCDIMMPEMTGIQLRAEIDKDDFLRKKSIPFIFLTVVVSKKMVEQAYDLTVQGYHLKGETYDKLKEGLDLIVKYWQACMHPNSVGSVY